jgi:outer membrane phospholipase A
MYEQQPLTYAHRRLALKNYDAYKRSTSYALYDVYGSCSSAKMRAWDYCKELMHKFDGYGLKVISHNCHQFTAGFMFESDGKEMFMYISKNHDIAVEVA